MPPTRACTSPKTRETIDASRARCAGRITAVGLSTAATIAIVIGGAFVLQTQQPTTPALAQEHNAPAALSAPQKTGQLSSPLIKESSGLASSLANPGHLWTHNDSGNDADLFLIDPQGTLHATVRVQDARNIDWEDITSFAWDDRPMLLIADTGDNLRQRTDITLLITEDPAFNDRQPTGNPPTLTVKVERSIQLRYADGPRDCEAVAVDQTRREVVLVSKEFDQFGKTHGLSGVYVADLDNDAPEQLLSRVADLPLTLATGLDISRDGRRAIVVTYGNGYLWERTPEQTWGEAFKQKPVTVLLPPRGQGESVAWAADGRSIYLTSEGVGKSVWQVPVPDSMRTGELR